MNTSMTTAPLAFTALAIAALTAFTKLEATPTAPPATSIRVAAPFDHSAYDRLLKKYVNDKGLVNYKGLKANAADLKAFDAYLTMLSKNRRRPAGVSPSRWPTGSTLTTPTPFA